MKRFNSGFSARLVRNQKLDSPTMIPLVIQHKCELADLRQWFKVERLDLFGSAADGSCATESLTTTIPWTTLPFGAS